MTAVLAAAISQLWPELLWSALWISFASGVVSLFALLPGILIGGEAKSPASRANVFMVGCVAAMAIRVTGTVALLVTCGYQMHFPLQTLAIFVCGWYVLLTALEIVWLAKASSQFDSQPLTASVDPTGVTHTC